MPAPAKNQFWKQRTKHGRDKLFTTPEILWDAACEYFEWVDSNPLEEQQLFAFQGSVTKESANKMRAYTWEGLELFLDITDRGLLNYKKEDSYKDFFPVITRIEKIIYNQKFTGAAAGLLHPNIIARDLHLVDKKEVEQNTYNHESIFARIEPAPNE